MADPILTLEPLIDAVREGVVAAGWSLSGLQKTTSHQFEGRWDGDSTRSAYLFFHSDDLDVPASVDVYLDETSRGLTGNLALVTDLRPLGSLAEVRAVLEELKGLAEAALPQRWRRPLTLRFRLPDASEAVADAEAEVRFKVRIAATVVEEGHAAVTELCRAVVVAFGVILAAPELGELSDPTD